LSFHPAFLILSASNFPSERASRRPCGADGPPLLPYSGAGARWTSSEEVRRGVEAQTAAASGKRSWVAVLLGYAGRCRGKMAASLAASVASVAMGFVPFYAVYRIMEIVMGASGGEGGAGAWDAAVPWIAAAAAAYVASKVLFGVSTLLSHVS